MPGDAYLFKVCRWLDDDEFNEILEVARYRGRELGCSVFELDVSRILKEGLRPADVLSMLQEKGAVLSPRVLIALKSLEAELQTVVISEVPLRGYALKSKAKLSEYLKEFRSRGVLHYSKEARQYIVKPYAILDVVKKLSSEGFKIRCFTKLLDKGTLSFEVKLRVELRDYQLEALKEWLLNDGRGVIALPAGSGKTVIALAALAELRVPTLIVVYTRDQLNQWYDKLIQLTNAPRNAIGLFYGETKILRPITITTYQTAYRYTNLLTDKFGLLIVDEVHHLPADKFRKIAVEILAPYRMGLSATPKRSDGRTEELFSLMGNMVYYKSFHELAEKGYLAPFVLIPIYVDLTKQEKTKYMEVRKKLAQLSAGRSIEELLSLAKVDGQARKALSLLNELRKIAAMTRNKLVKLKEVVEEELKRGSKIIVFTQYVEQAIEAGRVLNAPVITGKLDDDLRKAYFDAFRQGRVRVLVLTTVGDEGIDVPDADVGVVLSGSGSPRQFIQRLGRLLRPSPGKVARLYEFVAKGTHEERKLRQQFEHSIDLFDPNA